MLVRRIGIRAVVGVVAALLVGCSTGGHGPGAASELAAGAQELAPFQVAMIPDTQNYVDYTHQKAEGFAFDASEQMLAQMAWIAQRGRKQGGEIAFVASVGDVWQHQTKAVDEAHEARGLGRIEKSLFGGAFKPTDEVFRVEIPKAVEAYELIAAAEIPFGVAPGNHDYDAMWSVVGYPPNFEKKRSELRFVPEDIGMLHVGGLDNFRSVFGDDKKFFRDKPWYVDSFRGGANAAQIFEGGGYRFLHITLEMQPGDEVLAWVEGVLAKYPNTPTILSTHDYMDGKAQRVPNPILDFEVVDPDHHNSPEQLFTKLIAPNDQIFLVLCGHEHGQAMRVDANEAGHAVYQILADYQDRGQSAIEAGQPKDPFLGIPTAIGDGWFRLMRFDLGGATPKISVRTYSSHYRTYSADLATYADWYRDHEQPGMSDSDFYAADEYEIELRDFRTRFGAPRTSR